MYYCSKILLWLMLLFYIENARAENFITIKTITSVATISQYTTKKLDISHGGGVTIPKNKIIKLAIPRAGRYQIFFGLGKVEFSNKGDIYPEWFGVIPNSSKDSQPFFQKAVDSMVQGGRLLIQSGTYYVIASKPTISKPKRILIQHNDVSVEGLNTPIFIMKGISEKYLRSIEDYNSSGRDIFSVFTWMLTDNGLVKDIKIIGDYDGKSAFNFKSPRAKGIANIGSHNFEANKIHCLGVFGNCINITPASGLYDGKYRPVIKYRIINSIAEYCWENGFNAMGGTSNGFFINNRATHNSSTGFEAATTELIVKDNILTQNKYAGMSISSVTATVTQNMITNNGPVSRFMNSTIPLTYTTLAGAGLVLSLYEPKGNSVRKLIITQNIIKNNSGYGIMLYPKVSNIVIENNRFENNSTMQGSLSHGNTPFYVPYASEIYIVGKKSEFIHNIDIINNFFLNINPNIKHIINVNAAHDILIDTNIYQLYKSSSYQAYFQADCINCTASNNKGDGKVLISPFAHNSTQFNDVDITP